MLSRVWLGRVEMAALLALFSSFVFHGNDDEDDQETRILVAAFTMAVKRNDLDAVRQCLDKGSLSRSLRFSST